MIKLSLPPGLYWAKFEGETDWTIIEITQSPSGSIKWFEAIGSDECFEESHFIEIDPTPVTRNVWQRGLDAASVHMLPSEEK